MTITLSFITSLIFLRVILDHSLSEIKDRVDVTVYFQTNAPEDKIISLKSALEKLPEVASIEYVSADQALQEFRKRHEGDYLTLQALEELDFNPLGGFINIKTRETSQYESVAKILEGKTALSSDSVEIVDNIDYNRNKSIIDKLTNIIDEANRFGTVMTIVLILVSFVITFNTIRLAIYITRDEIGVMRIVGASNWYIRWPFIIEGMIYGALSAFITLILFYPITLWLKDGITVFLGLDLLEYYLGNFWEITGIVLVLGVGLGALSSFLPAWVRELRFPLYQKFYRIAV